MVITCKKCEISKDQTEFHKDNRNKNGYSGTCKECQKKRRRERMGLEVDTKPDYSNYELPEHLKKKKHKCESCDRLLYRTEFRTYGKDRKRAPNCTRCLTSNDFFKNYTRWENKHKDTEEVQLFLNHLRRITGVRNGEELLKKYRKE